MEKSTYNSYSPLMGYEQERQKVEPTRSTDVRQALARMAAKEINPNSEWRDRALCRVVDPEIFDESHKQVAKAKEYCAACDVRAQCLEYALGTNQNELIWGGLTPDERRELKRRSARERWNS